MNSLEFAEKIEDLENWGRPFENENNKIKSTDIFPIEKAQEITSQLWNSTQ